MPHKYPNSITICGVKYQVAMVDNLQDDEGTYFYGRISHVDLNIEVEANQHHDVCVQSLLHETLHGLFHQTGHFDIDEEERIVQMLGCQLPHLLRSNPELVKLLLGGTDAN